MIRKESTGKKCSQMFWRLAKWDAKPHLAFLTSSNVDLPSNEQTLLGVSVQPPEQCCKENGSWFILSTELDFCFYWWFWPAAPINFTCGGNVHDVTFSPSCQWPHFSLPITTPAMCCFGKSGIGSPQNTCLKERCLYQADQEKVYGVPEGSKFTSSRISYVTLMMAL